MSIIKMQEFETYSGDFSDDVTRTALKQTYLDAAESIVRDYLGFDPTEENYIDVFSGNGTAFLQLNAKPFILVALSMNGTPIDLSRVRPKRKDSEYVYARDFVFEKGNDNIEVEYEAGYSVIPGAIKLCILRIAALLLTESDGNIGITSKSFDNSSRSFYNFTNFSKYLMSVDGYRLTRLE